MIKPIIFKWVQEGDIPESIVKIMNRTVEEITEAITDERVIKRGMALIESSRLDGELHDPSSLTREHWPNNYTLSVCNRSIAGY